MSSGHRGGPFEISSPILTYCKLGVHSLCVPQLMPRQHHRSEFPFSVFARRVMYTRAPPNARSSHSNRMAIGVLASFGMGSLSKHHSFLSRFARGIQSVRHRISEGMNVRVSIRSSHLCRFRFRGSIWSNVRMVMSPRAEKVNWSTRRGLLSFENLATWQNLRIRMLLFGTLCFHRDNGFVFGFSGI